MNKKETVKKYILFLIGLFFMGFGIALTKRGELGVSPISSVPNVLSYKFAFFSMGTWLIVWNFVMIAGQIVILRRNFKPIQLLQIPVSFLFGYFTDIGVWCAAIIPTELYIIRLILVLIGMAVLGFGISLTVIADVIMNAGEAFVKVLADALGKEFGNVKIVFDVSCVVASVIISLIFFKLQIVGTREGTLIAAFGTGMCVKLFCRLLRKPLSKLITI